MEPTILYIDTSRSVCGACNKEALPWEKAHDTLAGHPQSQPGKGCKKVFTHISSHYGGDAIKEAAIEMRPDLPWHPRFYEAKPIFANEAGMQDFQDIGEPYRQGLGIDGTAGDAQDIDHPYTVDATYPDFCIVCGLAQSYNKHHEPEYG